MPAAGKTPGSAATRARQLRDAIHAHDHRYYVLDAPTASDAEYTRHKSAIARR